MDSIKKEVMQRKAKKFVHNKQQRDSTPAGSTKQNTMVGFDGVSLEIMDKLTGGQLDRQTIPIIGMSGIGKTTLARNIYQDQVVVQHFDILAWVTISQEYKMREILLKLLQESGESLIQMNEKELGDKLHKRLSGRRYLIIIDDIWDIEAWDQLKFLFPDNNNGSRIMLTTRLSNLASEMAGISGIEMGLLDEENSWNLFSKIVFGEEGCLLELEGIGKEIVKSCRGLPLSIVVIGGLLAKSNHTRQYWEYVSKKLNSVVNLEDNERCLKILYMSYKQLPVHLKPCFLYMGVFSEDSTIAVSTLVKLWVAEGFLKPISGKSLEDVAKEYFKELIDRNLILVHTWGSIGSIRYCNIHDLIRDLCVREARKERFYNVMRRRKLNIPQGKNTQRRIVIPKGRSGDKVLNAMKSMPLARSAICNIKGVLPSINFRLLRILKTNKDLHYGKKYFLENLFQLVNSRYLAVGIHQCSAFPSSVCLLWNLQTLIADSDYKKSFTAPAEIWNMRQLRHVVFRDGLYLPDPPRQDDIVLGNLQTLMRIRNFKFGEEVVKRIPNIKKLKTSYISKFESGLPDYFLNNLGHLHKLESFCCRSFLIQSETHILQSLTFPHSLKKLAIGDNFVHWQDMLEKIGSLPQLEKLELHKGSFRGRKWETIDGQFSSLKFLLIYDCRDLECWTIENSHFPRLEHLFLRGLVKLKEIPSEIAEIPTLKSIKLVYCTKSTVISAKKVVDAQEELYGEVGLQVRVETWEQNEALERLASPNFHVEHRRRL